MRRTKAGQVNARDRTCPPYCCASAVQQDREKLCHEVLRTLCPKGPSYFLPFPSGTFKALSLMGPNKTKLLSSSRGASWACSVYSTCVHIIQQGPSPIMEIDDDPSSSQPLSAWAPCPSPYSWSCGGRDVSRAVTCFLIHCNITRHHKSLSLSFSFSVFIERIQCLENSWYYLMIFG